MKKIVSLMMLVSLCAMTFGPALAVAQTSPITTGLTKDTTGGADPIVKAKWEAYGAADQGTGSPIPVTDYYKDEKEAAGAQFVPSGEYQVNTEIALCAIVTDPDGLADITTAPEAVYGDVFYPENIALGSSHVALTGQSGDGCGAFMQEDKLAKLTKAQGLELFCGNVRTYNTDLPTFGNIPGDEGTFDYDEICALDGELQKETAAVYCTTKEISYEDPSGDYEVWAVAVDQNGLQDTLVNSFTYLPLTNYEADFTSVGYGSVRLGVHKLISGNLVFAVNDGRATVRNIGNTRLQMSVLQDDMGFGKTDITNWNVRYDARVGNDEADWKNYNPETTNWLQDTLDLSETDEMDFSILVSKFPPTHVGNDYTGTMTLGARSQAHIPCGTEI